MGTAPGTNGILTARLSFEVAVGPTTTTISVRSEDPAAHAPVGIEAYHMRRGAPAQLIVECVAAALVQARGRGGILPPVDGKTVGDFDANGVLALVARTLVMGCELAVEMGGKGDATESRNGSAGEGAAPDRERAEQLVDPAASH